MNDPAPATSATATTTAPAPGEPLPPSRDDASFVREWERWHAEHERRRTDPLGLLAAIGLHWLTQEPIAVPGVPGSWSRRPASAGSGGGDVILELAEGDEVRDGDEVLTGTVSLGGRLEQGSVLLGFSTVGADGQSVDGLAEIARRGEGVILRPRRGGSSYLAGYPGTPAYPPNPAWVVPARFHPFESPRPTGVGSVVEGLEHVFDSPGELEVTLGEDSYRLIAFSSGTSGALTVLLRDGTSGVTTYAACRSLSVPAPDDEGRTVLDFNRAVNLPCAYTDHATCPLPPAQNRVAVAIQAGEKLPRSRVQ